jgi:hypothetical protein
VPDVFRVSFLLGPVGGTGDGPPWAGTVSAGCAKPAQEGMTSKTQRTQRGGDPAGSIGPVDRAGEPVGAAQRAGQFTRAWRVPSPCGHGGARQAAQRRRCAALAAA